MSWISLMPFPAFNPLNWWALANPANAMRASLHTTQATLDAWRAGSDGLRAMVRAQQDAALSIIGPKAEDGAVQTATAPESLEEADSEAVAARFVSPMVEVTRAYGRMGKAFIVAQRDTMRAFTDAEKPH
jgi:hypothetical protein